MESSISRRDLLLGGAGTLMVAGVSAASTTTDEHAGHEHGGNQALVEAARTCVAEGEACLAHCLAFFANGDTSLQEVLRGPTFDQLAELFAGRGRHLDFEPATPFWRDASLAFDVSVDSLDAATRTQTFKESRHP
jgi:hypothetical protein